MPEKITILGPRGGHIQGNIPLEGEVPIAYLDELFVPAKLSGRGWGHWLIEQFVNRARESGARSVEGIVGVNHTIWTDASRLIKFYESSGFEIQWIDELPVFRKEL